jgi:hypothetical protein
MADPTRRIHPKQMGAFVDKLQSNMRGFIEVEDKSTIDKLEFITQQYVFFEIVTKVLSGTVHFTGCSQPGPT